MSLYFKNKQGRIYHNDCLKTLDFLTRKGKKVDMILCDPPYGTTPFSWDKTLNMNEVWPFLKEIVKPHSAIVMTAYQPFTTMLINSNPDWFKYCWIWAKSKVGDIFNAKNKPDKKMIQGNFAKKNNNDYKKMVYNLLPGANKMLPKVFLSKKEK